MMILPPLSVILMVLITALLVGHVVGSYMNNIDIFENQKNIIKITNTTSHIVDQQEQVLLEHRFLIYEIIEIGKRIENLTSN